MAIPGTTIAQAIDGLLKWKTTQSNSQNPQLLPEDDFIYLILTLKKIPQPGKGSGVARINPNKIPLPHSLITPDSLPEICLIIDDRNLTSKDAKQKIKDEGISVTKVLKISKLKTDYKPFESKRKLCDSYELFFADKRVIPLLPKLLGKQFFRKKKLPLGVDLSHKNWKEQMERGLSSGLLYFRTGTCCVMKVAKVSMEKEEIIENVSAAVEGAIEFVPKKLLGVRSFHLKFSDSVALPLYQSLPDIKLRIEGAKDGLVKEVEDNDDEEMVEVGLKKKSKKARIHEVANDVSDGEVENGDLELVEDKPTKKSAKAKKRKGNVVEVENKKKTKKVVEVNHEQEEEDEEVENNEPESVEVVKEAKVGKNSDKKRKGNAVEETKSSDKKAKKKGVGESTGKKEKRKGRSVSRV